MKIEADAVVKGESMCVWHGHRTPNLGHVARSNSGAHVAAGIARAHSFWLKNVTMTLVCPIADATQAATEHEVCLALIVFVFSRPPAF
jgi:hypothetical protein